MKLDQLLQLRPKKYSEEAALLAVDLTLTHIKDAWFRSYIAAPGGAWQELYIEYDGQKHRFYIGRDAAKVDLILQKEDTPRILFLIGEAKEEFKGILRQREPIKRAMLGLMKRIAELEINSRKPFAGGNFTPILAFISGVDLDVFGSFAQRVLKGEMQLINQSLEDLGPLNHQRIAILSYIVKNQTQFFVAFSTNFDDKLKQYFAKTFS